MGSRLLSYIQRVVTSEHDTAEEVQQKMSYAVMLMVAWLSAPIEVLSWLHTGLRVLLYQAGFNFTMAPIFFFIMVYRKRLGTRFEVLLIGLSLVNIMFYDLILLPVGARGWYFAILLMEGIRTTMWLRRGVALATALWLLLTAVESAVRFGLLDLPFLSPYDDRLPECERPPCAGGGVAGMRNMFPAVVMFAGVKIAENCSKSVSTERLKLQASVQAARDLSESLAKFNLADAEAHLSNHAAALPPEMRESFTTLLHNLATYRPYLPQALFEVKVGRDDNTACSSPDSETLLSPRSLIPGYATRKAAIAFTDIRQSTALWEHSRGCAMGVALELHNTIIRDAIHAHRGYEVKTIGDAFMVAWESPLDAMRFGCAVQSRLMDTEWPADLSRGPEDDDGYGMLAVRIGINYGPVSLEHNALTRRYDYHGPTINKAARVESAGVIGGVTVPVEILELIDASGLKEMVQVPYTEKRAAKGLAQKLELVALVPPLAGPAHEALIRRQCAPPQSTTDSSSDVDSRTSAHVLSSTQSLSSVSAGGLGVHSWGGVARAPSANTQRSGGGAPIGSVGVVQMRYAPADLGAESLKMQPPGMPFSPLASRRDPDNDVAAVSQGLRDIVPCLEESDGSLSFVIADLVVVSWGVYTSNAQHVPLAVRFAALLYDRTGAGEPGRGEMPGFHTGLAAGAVCGREVCVSATQRLLTLEGPCVDLAVMLCSAAAELKTHALVASLSEGAGGDHRALAVLKPHIRPVDDWHFPAAPPPHPSHDHAADGRRGTPPTCLGSLSDRMPPQVDISDDDSVQTLELTSPANRFRAPTPLVRRAIVVSELRLATLSDACAQRSPRASTYNAGYACSAWSEEYTTAYRLKDAALLRRWADDPVIARVATMFDNKTHLQHSLL